jgi:UDP-N-acetylmuramyl pentapeptide phosphotransferase/UDP-N-acetylglucosamine-1-phosphate transferase
MLGALGALLGLLLAAFTDNLWWILITAPIPVCYIMYVMVMVQYEKFCDEKSDFWKKMKE